VSKRFKAENKVPSVWIGFDPREAAAFAVCRHSLESMQSAKTIPVRGIVLNELRKRGLYWRPTEKRSNGQLWDTISDAPMSTEFAISRFLTPHLAGKSEWALFMDCDILCRKPINALFHDVKYKEQYAVMCVKHHHEPSYGIKMDGQAQVRYARKNWSSVMLFNLEHPSNKKLTIDMINTLPGRDLHRFCWLEDHEIGSLDVAYNYLVGHSVCQDPILVHYTDGIPGMAGYEDCEYAEDYRRELEHWAASR
jgi:hypothetical protein